MLVFMVTLSLIGGALLSIQAAINGKLGQEFGALQATFINFFTGTVLSLLLVLFLEPAHQTTLLEVHKWQLCGAFFGIIYILLMIFAIQRIGTAVATVGVILGQLGISILVDTFGLFENARIPLSLNRVGALVLLVMALYFIYTSQIVKNDEQVESGHGKNVKKKPESAIA